MRPISLALSTILCFFVLVATTCSKPQAPEFKNVKNVAVEELTLSNVTIKGDAVCFNPNGMGITIRATDIDVSANEVAVGKVTQELKTKVPANSDFSIPLVVSFPPKKLLSKGSGLLGGLLSALSDQKVNMHYKGTITVEVLGVGIKVPLDEQQEVLLKK